MPGNDTPVTLPVGWHTQALKDIIYLGALDLEDQICIATHLGDEFELADAAARQDDAVQTRFYDHVCRL